MVNFAVNELLCSPHLFCRSRVEVLDGVRLLCEDLDGAVVVDGDGARGDEKLLGGALLLEHRHHAGPERGEESVRFGRNFG